MTEAEDETFKKIIEDYEANKNESWFPKTLITLQNGPPDKLYTEWGKHYNYFFLFTYLV